MHRLRDHTGAAGWVLAVLVVLAAGVPQPARAYTAHVHQELTFLAAKQLGRCLSDSPIAPLGPLEVRYVVRRNVAESERSVLRRMFQWRYYDRSQKQRTLLGLIETRLHRHYNENVRELERADSLSKRYSTLGTLVHHLQQVTVPAHVVPIFYLRVWPLASGDRLDEYPLDLPALEAAVGTLCEPLFATDSNDLKALLTSTAEATRAAIRAPIPGMPASWTEFWQSDGDPGDFGDYGSAGNNFGDAARFRCGPRRRAHCHLVDNDPIYAEFALQRHLDAVLATMRAMLIVQRSMAPTADATVTRARPPDS